jgi:hypothetical protein
MARALSVLLVVILALSAGMPVFAKKHPTTTTAPTTQEAAKGKESAVETHKHRAAEFENGKELDAAKTKDKVGTLSDQVNALDKKLKDSGKGSAAEAEAPATGKHHHAAAAEETPVEAAAPTGKHHHAAEPEETPAAAPATGKHHHATTQPAATQETKSEKKSK